MYVRLFLGHACACWKTHTQRKHTHTHKKNNNNNPPKKTKKKLNLQRSSPAVNMMALSWLCVRHECSWYEKYTTTKRSRDVLRLLSAEQRLRLSRTVQRWSNPAVCASLLTAGADISQPRVSLSVHSVTLQDSQRFLTPGLLWHCSMHLQEVVVVVWVLHRYARRWYHWGINSQWVVPTVAAETEGSSTDKRKISTDIE